MKVTIIFFSPCGSTKKVAGFIEDEFLRSGWEVQSLNMTRDNDLFPDLNFTKFISRIEKHDLLLVGGPIYIDHLHYNVLDLIRNLPKADDDGFSSDAGVFTTFGKITPGVGAPEAAVAFSEGGRQTWAALEVDSEHCISRNIDYNIGAELPGEEVVGLVQDFVKHMVELVEGEERPEFDITSQLTKRFDEFPQLRDEKWVTDNSFPDIQFNYDLCGKCYMCVEGCPVNYLIVDSEDGYPRTLDNDICVHCTNCLFTCPTGAVVMDLYNKKPFFVKQLQDQNLKPDGPSISKLIK